MKSKKHHRLFYALVYCFCFLGCTSGSGSGASSGDAPKLPVVGDSPVRDIIEDIINMEAPEIKKVSQEVVQISK
jgi:hypothetical protein